MEKTTPHLELITRYFTEFTPKQLQQLEMLDGLYRDWNSKINVISRKDIDSLYEKHILHSLAIAAVFDLQPGKKVLDIGTGGGFPGIPLAIFFPETTFLLADSIGKKIKVVQAVAEATGLTNITAMHTRVEDIKKQQFDIVVSRAVAPLSDLLHWSKPLLKISSSKGLPQENETPVPNGLICLKGGELGGEIAMSGTRPRMIEIRDIFPEPYFKDKYLLYVPFKSSRLF